MNDAVSTVRASMYIQSNLGTERKQPKNLAQKENPVWIRLSDSNNRREILRPARIIFT